MGNNPQVLGLLEEMLDSGKTPEEVCRDCPNLLPEVRQRWQEFRLIDDQLEALLPGLRPSTIDVNAPVPLAAGLAGRDRAETRSGERGDSGLGSVVSDRAAGRPDPLLASALGFDGVANVHVGRLVELDVSDASRVPEMCEKLLANPLIEDYEIQQ